MSLIHFLILLRDDSCSHAESKVFACIAEWKLTFTQAGICMLEGAGVPNRTLQCEKREVLDALFRAKQTRSTNDVDPYPL